MEVVMLLVIIFIILGYCGYFGKKLCSSCENFKKKNNVDCMKNFFLKLFLILDNI